MPLKRLAAYWPLVRHTTPHAHCSLPSPPAQRVQLLGTPLGHALPLRQVGLEAPPLLLRFNTRSGRRAPCNPSGTRQRCHLLRVPQLHPSRLRLSFKGKHTAAQLHSRRLFLAQLHGRTKRIGAV